MRYHHLQMGGEPVESWVEMTWKVTKSEIHEKEMDIETDDGESFKLVRRGTKIVFKGISQDNRFGQITFFLEDARMLGSLLIELCDSDEDCECERLYKKSVAP
jgi:hypothetical protein